MRRSLSVPSASAQTDFAIVVGVSQGSLSMSAPGITPNTSPVYGPAFDVYATFPLAGGLGAQLGLGYVSRGADFNVTEDGAAIDAGVSFGDWIVTALARFEPASMFHVAAGPHLSLNSDCSADVTVVAPGFRHSAWGDCDSAEVDLEYSSFDYGFTGTAGVEFDIGSVRAVVNAMYHHGLGNIDEDPYTARHRAMAFHAGIVRPIG